MKRVFIFTLIVIISFTLIFYLKKEQHVEESMIYFPIHETIHFDFANTSINLLKQTKNKKYTMMWDVQSSLSDKAYLRQDISLLFINGMLIDSLGEWKENIKNILLQKEVSFSESAKVDIISFHHGEIHEKDEQIKSAQQMTSAKLYIVDSKNEPLHSFVIPVTKTDKEWKQLLDNTIDKNLENVLINASKKYSLQLNNYEITLLTDLIKFNDEPLLNFSMDKTKRIIGELWEGLYKNYYLNIKKADGTLIDPINSTIPLLLFSKHSDELLVIFEDANKELFLLRQSLQDNH